MHDFTIKINISWPDLYHILWNTWVITRISGNSRKAYTTENLTIIAFVHDIKAYRGLVAQLRSFFISAIDGIEQKVSSPGRFNPAETCKHSLLLSVINAVINIEQELTKLVIKDDVNGKWEMFVENWMVCHSQKNLNDVPPKMRTWCFHRHWCLLYIVTHIIYYNSG